MIESVEPRKLFAATLANGVLEITGTEGDDAIRVSSGTSKAAAAADDFEFRPGNGDTIFVGHGGSTRVIGEDRVTRVITPGKGTEYDFVSIGEGRFAKKGGSLVRFAGGAAGDLVTVRINGVRQSFLRKDVKEIRIASGDGDDRIRSEFANSAIRFEKVSVESGASAFRVNTIPVGGIATEIDAGAGDDVVTLGGSPETVRGGEGNDTVRSAGAGDVVRSGAGDDVLFGFNRATLVGGDDADTYRVLGGRVRVDFDEDQDSLHVSRTATVLDLAGEPIEVKIVSPRGGRITSPA
jgi:Ca2+-binding RTX toxin-like protein